MKKRNLSRPFGKNARLWPILCAAEAAMLLCLCIAFILNTNAPPPVDISTLYADLYAEPDLSETVWPEEKEPFAAAGIRYREREAAFMRFPGGPVDLCCLGDSITQQFEWQDAFPGLRAANRGIGSDTTSGILARLDSVAATEPKVLSLMAGANDMGEEGWMPEGIASNFRMILEELHTRLPETKFLVNSMLPTSAAHPN